VNERVDTESIYSEECIEFNSTQDEKEVLDALQYYSYDNKDIANLAGANFISMIVENYHGNKNVHGCPDEKVQQMKRKFYVQL